MTETRQTAATGRPVDQSGSPHRWRRPSRCSPPTSAHGGRSGSGHSVYGKDAVVAFEGDVLVERLQGESSVWAEVVELGSADRLPAQLAPRLRTPTTPPTSM